ncbi:MAG: TonB-dependent receptor [Bacteroidetes bacterium]|nr:TonB-dependent receptor [Bacteroidota bacterium]
MKYNFNIINSRCQIFVLIINIFLAKSAISQNTINGTVVDITSLKGLSNVSVKNISKIEGTVTDTFGNFALICTKGDLLEFSKTGYLTLKFKYQGKSPLDIKLEQEIISLEEVFISASKVDQSVKNTSVSVEVIKPYIINNKIPSTAENTVDQIPGVMAINGQVVIRSGSGWSYGAGSRVAVLLDGMLVMSGDAGQVQWSFIPLENVESIEVIKGASSVLFGSSALNGVINIRTKMPVINKKIENNASVFYGIYDNFSQNYTYLKGSKILGTIGIRAFQMQRINKNSYFVRLNYFNDAGYRMSDNDNRIQFGAKYQRDLKKINGFAGVNINLHNGKSESFLLWESNKLPYTSLDSQHTKNRTFKLNIDPYLYFYFKGWKNVLQLRYFQLNNEVVQDTSKNDQSNFSKTIYCEYHLSKKIKTYFNSTFGVVASFTQTESPLYQGNQQSENRAAFAQLNFSKGILSFDVGLRYEFYRLNNYIESKPVVRSGMSIKVAKATFLRASYGQGYRFPTIAETFVLTSAGPVKIFPNNNLKSETGWSSEIGVKQGIKIGKISGIADIAFFLMQYDRMMEFTFGIWEKQNLQNPIGAGFKSVNVADAQISGVDFTITGAAILKKSSLKFIGGYTFSDALALKPNLAFAHDIYNNELTYTNTSSNPSVNFLKYRPKHLVRLDLQYDIKSFEFGASYRYNSPIKNIDKAFITFPISALVPGIEDFRQMGDKGDYIFDVRAGKKIKNFKILFTINNLFNRVYMTRPCDVRPPRNITILLSWKM